jgi:hypothetical protein
MQLFSNSLLTIFFLCPVPEDQKPLQEYIELKQNPVFNWIFFSKEKYNSNLFLSSGFLFLSSFFFFSFFFLSKLTFLAPLASLSETTYLSYFFHFSFLKFFYLIWLIFLFVFCLFFLQIFFTLQNISSHFENSRLVYEEGSWYQGKIWEKSFSLMKNEKLIRIHKIEPSKKRIQITFFSLFFFVFFVLFFFLK